MIKITGYSDDIVVLDGDIYDEFGSYNSDLKMEFSDGTILVASYNGIWSFEVINKGDLFREKINGSYDDDINELVILDDGIKWVNVKGTVVFSC